MNLPNKITMVRIFLSVVLLVLLIIPVSFPTYLWFGKVTVSLKYIIGGVVFLVASLTDTLDGYVARKNHQVTDFGKVMDAIADKVLVNGVLIALACDGLINVAVPVIIISRDIIVDSIKMVAGQKNGAVAASKTGKLKTACMLVGITLLLFYDLPFSLFGVHYVARVLITIATVLSIMSGVEYYNKNKKYILSSK
jgi:CDP-diacylglycerol--glycerol-3-phosphate 3-phosphatidyltransferase